jgi:hypothetical protein
MDLYEIYWWIALGISLAINKLIVLKARMTLNDSKHNTQA